MSSVPSTSLSTVDTATVSVPDTTIASNNSASSLKQLKGSLHLDLSSATSSKKQNITADLLSLIKASPSIEKFLSQASATTPTPTKVLYPTDVTLAQRQYAQGFLDALAHVQKLNGFVPTPTLLNSPSFLTPLLPAATTTATDPTKTATSPVLASPSREPLSVIMQAMSGMSGFAGYSFSQLTPTQLYNPVPPPTQPMVPSTSAVVNTVNTQLSHHIKNEIASSASDESKESSYDMYAAESNNDAEACSSTRSNGSPRSQDELIMSSFPGDRRRVANFPKPHPGMGEYDLSEQERKKLERKRARNRMAATKCRQRKLQKISDLERQVNEEKATGNRLSQELKLLEASITQLRQMLHEHRSRGCVIPTK
uniref:BZIP domain-containing protein n=1 Tax=Parascaris univalens TaxID=6257 RepID=A0A915BCY5_PARUN